MNSANFSAVPDAPQSENLGLLEALYGDLAAIDFHFESVAQLLGEEAVAAYGRDQILPALRVLREATAQPALANAIRLFQLGQSLAAAEVAATWPRTGVRGLLELGLIEEYRGAYRARVALALHASDSAADLWVAHDLGAHQRPGVLRTDHVLGIGQASRTLAQITLRPPVASALDLGTGCGIQLFHLLSHSSHVTATDLSARALAFTRFNLLLNHRALGIDPEDLEARVALRQGNLFEPLLGQKFDLVATNPPFVITPRRAQAEEVFTYRDAGMAGDDLVSTLVRQLPGYLNPGGSAQLLANWEIRDHEQGSTAPWAAGIEPWFAPELDVWVIQREESTPSMYAEMWLRDASQDEDEAGYARQYDAYLDDFAARRVQSIGFGYVYLALPRTPRTTMRRFEALEHAVEQPLAATLDRDLRSETALREAGAQWQNWHLLVAADVTEERHQRPGAEHPGVILLRQGAGLRRTEILDTAQAGFVSACDGDLSVKQLVNALDSLIGEGDEQFTARLYAAVQRLIRHGFLRKV